MSMKQRATKCSGYIPPSQYVPVYSRPHRTSNVRLHEELSPITPKPSFDDPDSTRSRSIQQAVKAWLESSPKSVIGLRGRSPTDSPRTSFSSPDQAADTTQDGDLDQASGLVVAESPIFQKNRLTPWKNIVWKGGSSQSKAGDHIPAQNKITGGDQTTTEEKPAVQAKQSIMDLQEGACFSDIESDTDNYSQAIMEALKSSPTAPECYLKPPRVLEKAIVLYGGDREKIPLLREILERPRGNMDEIRGKELEDFPAREFEERRHGGGGGTTATDKCGDDSASDSESVGGEGNDMSGFISSAVSSPISLYEERRFGGEGMNLIQIAGSGEFAAESVPQNGRSKVKSDMDSSSVTQEFDSGAENRRPTTYFQSRRTTQPPFGTDGGECRSADSAHSRMAKEQEDRYEAQSRPVSGLSAQFVNGGKRDGPTKTAAVVPVPEDSQSTSDGIREEKASTPLEVVDSNQMRWRKQPFNRQETLERVRKEKFKTKAAAWEEAKKSESLNRYKREQTKIMAWEDHKKAKAEINLKKAELKLQEKRAKAIEKMENELARAHKKAEEKKAIAEAKRAEKAARAAEDAEIIRQHGRRPLSLFCFTP